MLKRRRLRCAVAGTVTVLASCWSAPLAPTAAAAEPSEPLRVLVVGDSVTQGSAGDWTWRYFLHKHLTSTDVPVDFVGPRSDLYDDVADTHGSHAYADPDFDRDHASRWGMTLAYSGGDVADLVRDHQPDVVLELLGLNDLGFLRHGAQRVADDLATFVADARSADPDVDVVLGQVPQTWNARVEELNALLAPMAEGLDEPSARVGVAEVDGDFSRSLDTWDGMHPNTRGDQRIAASFADALVALGAGVPYPRPLPDVPVGLRSAPVVSAVAGDGRVDLTWTGPPGATSERVHARDITAGTPLDLVADAVLGSSWSASGLVNGHVYGFVLQPVKGWWAAADDVRSVEVRARPLPPLPGAVRLTEVTSPWRDRVRVVGEPALGAMSYELQVARVPRCRDPFPRFRRAVTGLTRPRASVATTADLLRVRFVAVNVAGRGPATGSRCVRVR